MSTNEDRPPKPASRVKPIIDEVDPIDPPGAVRAKTKLTKAPGRPKAEATTQMNMRVSIEVREMLETSADAKKISMRQAMEEAIAEYHAKTIR